MALERTFFGTTPDGVSVDLFTLRNDAGAIARLTSYGARVTELHVPDRHGRPANVVLGFDSLARYLAKDPHLGCTVGRVTNRIANARFHLDGVEYVLEQNNGPHNLHSGTRGYDKVVWQAEPRDGPEPAVAFRHVCPHMADLFPGTLEVEVVYTLTASSELRIEYSATTDRPTIVNLTNHTYFNLRGAGRGDVLDHVLTVHASRYTPADQDLIPTGEIREVRGTPFDFTSPHRIGERIAQVAPGYDVNYVLDSGGGRLAPAARLLDETSGRVLEVFTTQPGVQLYTGNFLDGLEGIGGPYHRHYGLCLETQHFPDSIHHPNFPSTVLRPGEVYRQVTVWRFSAC